MGYIVHLFHCLARFNKDDIFDYEGTIRHHHSVYLQLFEHAVNIICYNGLRLQIYQLQSFITRNRQQGDLDELKKAKSKIIIP